jgi:tetratricopeptide (TPR) repeat protein
MTNEPDSTSLSANEETPEEVYQTLVRVLRRKRGFGLFFVQCSPSQGTEIVQRLPTALPDKRVQVLSIEPGGDRLYEQVKALWQSMQFDVLVLQGLELEVLAHEDAKQLSRWEKQDINPYLRIGVPPVLHHLNQQRERFRDRFPACFVLLLPPFMVDYFIQQAPDFFDWRSGLFRFPTDAAELDQSAHQLISEGSSGKYRNETSSARFHRILTIEDMLGESCLTQERRATLLNELGNLLEVEGKWQEAIASFEQSLQTKRELGDVHGVAQTLTNLGIVYANQGKWHEAIAAYEQSLQTFRELGDVHGVAQTLMYLGFVYSEEKWQEAIAAFEQSLQTFRELGDVHGVAQTLMRLGIVYRQQGKWHEAIAAFEQSLQTKRELGDVHGLAQTLANLGIVYRQQGKWHEAIAAFEQSLQTFRQLGDVHGLAQTLGNLGLVYHQQGKWHEAIAAYEESLQISRQLGDVHGVAQTLNDLGNVYRQQGKWQEAIAAFEQSLQTFRELGDVHGEGQTLANLGLLYKNRHQPDQAKAHWQEALTKLNPSSPDFQQVQQWLTALNQPQRPNFTR